MWVELNGRKWRVRDRIGTQKITLAEGFPTFGTAEAWRIQRMADRIRGDELVPRGGQMTVRQLVDEWWPTYSHALKPTALHSEGGRVRHHIVGLLGDVQLVDLDVQQWVADLEAGAGPPLDGRARKPLAPKTVSNCHGLLFTVMKHAVARRYVRANPCASTVLPRRVHREMRCLTDPEIGRLISATPTYWRPLVMLLVTTGLRWGEAVGLRVGRVDLLAASPRVQVVEHLHELSTGEIVFTDPKSARSRRTVSMPRSVAVMLAPLVAGRGSGELMFTTARGHEVRARNFRRGWLQWVANAGLVGLRVHDLRHTQAGILFSAHGLSLPAISRRLGHSSIAVTDQLYGHLREESDPGILAAIEAAISGIRTGELEDELADEMQSI